MNQKINYFSVCQVSKYMFFSVSNVISDVYLFMYHRISCVLFLASRSFLKPRYAGFMPSAQDFNKCKSHDLTKSIHQLPYSCFNRISSTFRSLSNLQYTTLHTHKLSYQIAKHQYANIDPTTPESYSTHDNCSAMMPGSSCPSRSFFTVLVSAVFRACI